MNNNKTALITGASSGFGYEFSKIFAKDGYNLILVARSENKLEELADELRNAHGIDVLVKPKDLFVSTAPQELYDELKTEGVHVDILINNAGFGNYGKFAENDLQDELNLVQLNVATVTHMTRLFVADMVARRSGKILNVASLAAFSPGPYLATYCASKAYVLFLTEAVVEEVASFGVQVMALCPGVSATGFQSTAKNEHSLIGGNVKALTMPADEIVAIAYQEFMAGKVVCIPGTSNKVGSFLMRFMPRVLIRKAGKKMMYTKELGQQ
ncbi:MAG: SDR family oxidoreductase [Pseudomonadales bacterium]|nr:SDR family oxidoreductase [Pseudomonadales bacterium]